MGKGGTKIEARAQYVGEIQIIAYFISVFAHGTKIQYL